MNTMTAPTRLFDCIEYQLAKFPKEDMLTAKENGVWQKYSTKEIQEKVNQLTAGLLSLGVSGNDMTVDNRDKIAIISNNRPEWLITDMAVQQSGAILVPIYPTTNTNEIEFIFNDAGVKYVFVSNDELFDKIKSIQSKIPSLKNIYTFNEIKNADHWSKVLQLATKATFTQTIEIKNSIKKEDLATIIYTSGTTGIPKGVMLSHHNIMSNVFNSIESFPFDEAPDFKALSFLPLNHIFEKLISYIYMYSGISIYYAESFEAIGDNLREVH